MKISVKELRKLIKEAVEADPENLIVFAMSELKAAYHKLRTGNGDISAHVGKADDYIHRIGR